MTLRLALRALVAQPIRAVVLACGFGLGIGAMAGLMGIGEVILEQSRSSALSGGGDVVIRGMAGSVRSARFLMTSLLDRPPLAGRTRVVSPSIIETLYLVDGERRPLPVRVTGGLPSRERALGDPECAGVEVWQDGPRDEAWIDPDPADVLRAMDRFHAIPNVPARAGTWAEWLYFNGSNASGERFYLTFLVGGFAASGRREAGVRLQLEGRNGTASYAARELVDEAGLLRDAPDLTIGRNRVRLDELDYRVHLELAGEAAGATLSGDLVLRAVPGRALPPLEVNGAGGWISGYVVPVMSGVLSGALRAGTDVVSFDGGHGYHDHNWGFWGGVTWQWGQVAHEDLSFVYGRIRPPADAFDPERMPGFLIALGPQGLLGQTSAVRIDERRDGSAAPSAIHVVARGPDLDLDLDLEVRNAVQSRFEGGPLGSGGGLEFFQMQALYRVSGSIGERQVAFTAPGSAETFGASP